jgi:hypothetical protein
MSDEIKTWLAQLRQALPCVPPIPTATLKSLHKSRDYTGMVQFIKDTMNVEVKLRIGWVNSGGPKEMKDAPAWVYMPKPMPSYGTDAFRALTIPMFFRKPFLSGSDYDQAAIAVAHELSHVVLDSIAHPLRDVEKAVDLTAMLLGFRELYETACYKTWYSGNTINHQRLGYLTPEEVAFANELLADPRPRLHIPPSFRPAAQIPLLLMIGLFIVGGSFPLYKMWTVHSSLVAEQSDLQRQLPKKINRYHTLTDVQVGVREITMFYEISARKRDIDLAAFRAALDRWVRSYSCADSRRANIREGATYSFEFWDSSRELIGRLEVASCA